MENTEKVEFKSPERVLWERILNEHTTMVEKLEESLIVNKEIVKLAQSKVDESYQAEGVFMTDKD